MKSSLCAALAVISLSALALPHVAHAVVGTGDIKVYHGSDCKVFGSTAWTDLSFSGYGVKNLATSARNIICPITKDSQGVWDGAASVQTNLAFVFVRLMTGSVAASYNCTVYVTTLNDVVSSNSYSLSSGGSVAANTLGQHNTPYLQSVDSWAGWSDKAYMLCTLGPQVRLLGYYLNEYGTTQP